MLTKPPRILVLLVAATLTMECSNFRRPDEGGTLHLMITPARWTPYDGPALPPPRRFPSITSTPRGTVVFGGVDARGPSSEGWLWDGTRWTALPTDGAPSPRAGHAAVWTGDALCVFGGAARGAARGDGACWSPGLGRWESLPEEGAPSPRSAMASVFAGGQWILWGGHDGDGNEFDDGARYDPTSRRWSALPGGGPRARQGASAVLSPEGRHVLIWGGSGEALALGAEDSAVLDLASSTWSPISIEGAPPARTGPEPVVVPGGLVAIGAEGAGRFEWSTRRWRAVDPCPFSQRLGATIAAVPGGVIVWGGRDETGMRGDGAVLDLATDRWTEVRPDGSPTPRMSAVAFTDDRGLLVLWGHDGAALRGDGFALR